MFFMVSMVAVIFAVTVMAVLPIGGRLRRGLRPWGSPWEEKRGLSHRLSLAQGLEQLFQLPAIQPDATALRAHIQFDT